MLKARTLARLIRGMPLEDMVSIHPSIYLFIYLFIRILQTLGNRKIKQLGFPILGFWRYNIWRYINKRFVNSKHETSESVTYTYPDFLKPLSFSGGHMGGKVLVSTQERLNTGCMPLWYTCWIHAPPKKHQVV